MIKDDLNGVKKDANLKIKPAQKTLISIVSGLDKVVIYLKRMSSWTR